MLDHLSLGVSDLARSTVFYDAVLAPLGVVRVWTAPDAAGYGYPDHDDKLAIKEEPRAVCPSARTHLAFTARNHGAVERFHAAAIANGATDDGAPALCPEYGPNYYAAFVIDPDGHRLEAVCHTGAADRPSASSG